MKKSTYIPREQIMKIRNEIKTERQISFLGVVIIELIVLGLIYLVYMLTPDFLYNIMLITMIPFGTAGVIMPLVLLRTVWNYTAYREKEVNRLSPSTKPLRKPSFKQRIGYRWRRLKEFKESFPKGR